MSDSEWLYEQCRIVGYRRPHGDVVHDFSERCAIRIADGWSENAARLETFRDFEFQCRFLR